MSVVVDASAFGPVLIADETDHVLPGLAEALTNGVVVPLHWQMEVANLVLVAARRGRLDDLASAQARQTVSSVIVTVDARSSQEVFGRTWALAERHQLTIYDGSYVELAQRLKLPLATNDRAMIRAAVAEKVELFGR